MDHITDSRFDKYTTQDLRSELRKELDSAFHIMNKLCPLLEDVEQSREVSASANGMCESGNLKTWLSEWETDAHIHESLKRQLIRTCFTYEQLDSLQLQEKIIATLDLQLRAKQLYEKYSSSLVADHKENK